MERQDDNELKIKRARLYEDHESGEIYLPEPAIWENHIFPYMKRTFTCEDFLQSALKLRLACKKLHQIVIQSPIIWNPCFRPDKLLKYLESAVKFGWDLSKSAVTFPATVKKWDSKYHMPSIARGEIPAFQDLMSRLSISELTLKFGPVKQGKNRSEPDLNSINYIIPIIPQSLTKLTFRTADGGCYSTIFHCLRNVSFNHGVRFCVNINPETWIERVTNSLREAEILHKPMVPGYVTEISITISPSLMSGDPTHDSFRVPWCIRETGMKICSNLLRYSNSVKTISFVIPNPLFTHLKEDCFVTITLTPKEWFDIFCGWNPGNYKELYLFLVYKGVIDSRKPLDIHMCLNMKEGSQPFGVIHGYGIRLY